MTKAEKQILRSAFLHVERNELALIDGLNSCEEFEPSSEFKAKMDEIINGTKKERHTSIRKRIIIIAISVLLAISFALSIGAVREFIVLVCEQGISVLFGANHTTPSEGVIENAPQYIPQGYSLSKNENYEIAIEKEWCNQNNKIFFDQSFKDGSELHITNENAQVIELNCEGKNTYCILTRNGAYSVFWSDDIYLYKMRFEGEFSIAEIEMIVSSVKN